MAGRHGGYCQRASLAHARRGQRVYCLDLADGKPVWQPQPRGEHLYVACVHKGLIVLVSRNAVDAIKLEDGRSGWGGRSLALPTGANVCGHGCYVGDQYYLPLSTGEVAAIDLNEGKIVATAKSPRRCAW